MSTQSPSPSCFLTKLPIVCLLAGICCALWGSAFPCVKIGYVLFSVDTSHVPSVILFAGTRFFLAGILAILIGSVTIRKPLMPRSRRTWRHILHLSLLQTIFQYIFFYIGLAHTTGVKGSIIGASNAFAALLIAALLFRQETLTGRKLLGCVLGFSGVVLVNLGQGGLDGTFQITGEGFVFLSSISYAFSSVFLKRYSAEDDPVLLSGWQFAVGGAVMHGRKPSVRRPDRPSRSPGRTDAAVSCVHQCSSLFPVGHFAEIQSCIPRHRIQFYDAGVRRGALSAAAAGRRAAAGLDHTGRSGPGMRRDLGRQRCAPKKPILREEAP